MLTFLARVAPKNPSQSRSSCKGTSVLAMHRLIVGSPTCLAKLSCSLIPMVLHNCHCLRNYRIPLLNGSASVEYPTPDHWLPPPFLQSHQAYSRVWHTTANMAAQLQQTTLAKTANTKVYPFVAPIVKPILTSDYLALAVDHMRPKDDTPAPPSTMGAQAPTVGAKPVSYPAVAVKY